MVKDDMESVYWNLSKGNREGNASMWYSAQQKT